MKKVAVLGAGNIGSLIATMLAESGDYDVKLISEQFLLLHHASKVTKVQLNISDWINFEKYLQDSETEIVISALPYSLNINVATIAGKNGIHYFDLTEDVRVKQEVFGLAQAYGSTIFMPQCGLAPGFINILGAHLMRKFDEVHTAKLRVGALPQNISNELKYNLTWSTNGLVNEYGNPCEAIVNGAYVDTLRPLEGLENTILDGIEYEAFNTSGGLGTLADTFGSKVKNLNYKTLRYPGHADRIKFLMFDMGLNEKRDVMESILEDAIPKTNQDVIVIYSSVSGMIDGQFREESWFKKVYPVEIAGQEWTGIQVTTAAGVCAAMDMVVNTDAAGFIKQEDILFNSFLTNRFGSYYQ